MPSISGPGPASAMRIVQTPDEPTAPPHNVCLAIGFFDGVHLGHQQVIRQALADAEQHEGQALVVTFDRHPNAVVAPDRIPPLIYPIQLRLQTIARLGVPTTFLIPFDESFSRQSGEDFILNLAQAWPRIRSICVGSQFKFGRRRQGNLTLLQRLGRELGFAVHGLAAVSTDGKPVSSTRVREMIRSGQLDAAGQMLGRPYVLAGRVVPGDRLGQALGFPTANLDTTGLVVPPSGVYAVHAYLKGVRYRAALNMGWRPTLKQAEPAFQVEAHLLDFQGDLYGADLEISFVQKLREEEKFPSLEALGEQIRHDIADARACFAAADFPASKRR
jgi:riboflavin kinase/FMN adenylyltransferase